MLAVAILGAHHGIEERILEAMAAVDIGHIVAVVVSQECNLTAYGVEGALDEGCGVEQLLLVDDDIAQEALAIGKAAPARSGDDAVEGADALHATKRLHGSRYGTLNHAAHAAA